jgi:hypothetical protein
MEIFCIKNRQKKFHQKKKFRKYFFLAIGVSQPIWGMPAKNWGV